MAIGRCHLTIDMITIGVIAISMIAIADRRRLIFRKFYSRQRWLIRNHWCVTFLVRIVQRAHRNIRFYVVAFTVRRQRFFEYLHATMPIPIVDMMIVRSRYNDGWYPIIPGCFMFWRAGRRVRLYDGWRAIVGASRGFHPIALDSRHWFCYGWG